MAAQEGPGAKERLRRAVAVGLAGKSKCWRPRKKEECGQDRRAILKLARKIAKRFARRNPLCFCTADDVVEGLSNYGHCPSALGLAAGLVFRVPGWALTCFRVKSRRRSRRGPGDLQYRLLNDLLPP